MAPRLGRLWPEHIQVMTNQLLLCDVYSKDSVKLLTQSGKHNTTSIFPGGAIFPIPFR